MIHIRSSYANAVISDDRKDLQGIHLNSKNIAIYQRDIKFLSKELDQITEQSVECRASGTIKEISTALNTYFTNELPEHKILLDDILNLLGLFEQVTKSSSFRILLATVNTNMCRKFHTDINDLRLLCTYVGQGTCWLPDEAVNQKALKPGSGNQEIVKNEEQIQQVRTGDVVLLKGALYPKANPILHRSPSIEKNGEKRLLLRIDTNEFLNFLT